MKGALSSWSEIPPELAGLVLHRLHAHVDRVRFAAVCKQWRTAAQQIVLPPPLPVLAVKDGTFYSMPRGEPLRFPGFYGGFIATSGNWLVYNRLHCLLLVDPFSGTAMTLPALSSIFPLENSMDIVVIKLIECSPHVIAALLKRGRNLWVAVCRPGAPWWSEAQKMPMWIFDIAFYQEKLYALSFVQDLFALDVSVDDKTGNPKVSLIGRVIKGGFVFLDHNFMRMLYLIESGGSLLMVRRNIFHELGHRKGQIHTFADQCEPDLAVFKPDFGRSQWVNATNVGDGQVLFLGTCSRAVCMPHSDLQDKRLWLLDDYRRDQCDEETCYGTGDVRVGKYSCPLPMISWSAPYRYAGAVWLFPSN